jgi:AcrR family transcriptional regulator
VPGGRPRVFDVDAAIDRALTVFWSKGYEGASISDLTEAMGIRPSSFYAAFGSKEALFRRALDRYMDGPSGYLRVALSEPSALGVVHTMLHGAIMTMTGADTPPGCLTVQAALAPRSDTPSVRQELVAVRRRTPDLLRQRFERARTDGDLPAGSDPAALARYVGVLVSGIAVEAAGGASRADLLDVADLALRTWRCAAGIYAGDAPREEESTEWA